MSTVFQPQQPAAVQPLKRIETHYRIFLARRWLGLSWRSAILCSAVTASALFTASGGQASIVPSGAALGLAGFALAIYPILWTRRSFVTSPLRIPASDNLAGTTFSILLSPRLVHLLASYFLAGAIFAAGYCWVLDWYRPQSALGLWTPTPRHPWHLNERFIFLVLGNSTLFFLAGLQDVFAHSLRPVWPLKRSPFTRTVQNALAMAFPGPDDFNPSSMTGGSFVLFVLTYFFGRRSAWRFLVQHSAGLLTPFVINFAKSSRNTITYSLIGHLLLLRMTMALATSMPFAAIMPYVTQPLSFDSFTSKSPYTPDTYLLMALKLDEPYYRHFTLMELLRVANTPARRKAIFSDMSRSPPLINSLWQEMLLSLGRSYQTLSSRGIASASRPPSAIKPASTGPDPRSIAIKQADIFRPVVKQKSTLSLALQNVLDGPIRPTPPTPVAKVGEAAMIVRQRAVKSAEDVQAQVVGRIEATPLGNKVVSEAKGWSARTHAWVGRTWATRRFDGVLPDVESALWIIDIFATLAVSSIEEDTYGYVQQVLPATMEAIVRYRSALVSLQNELVMAASSLGPSSAAGAEESRLLVAVPIGACEGSIRRISDRFGPSLSAFRFPPAIGHALADICKPAS